MTDHVFPSAGLEIDKQGYIWSITDLKSVGLIRMER